MSKSETGKSISYKDAGVDIDAGEALVTAIKPMAASTKRPGADADLGGFGGLFDLKAAGFEDPILVAATDGVGTKLKIAIEVGKLDTVGIDLVAMCVNDLIVQGAEPLLFLDYFATGKLDVEAGTSIVSGIAEGCRQSGSVLIGGETAEMPGMYAAKDFDLAGFSVGAAERGKMLDGTRIQEGDILLGLASSGVHSNGFSLVRKILDINNIAYSSKIDIDSYESVGLAFLEPTRIYVKSLLEVHKTGLLNGLAHITGGGLTENIPRILPKGLSAHIDASLWQLPPLFAWLREKGNLTAPEMIRTFNCGIGMVAVVESDNAPRVKAMLEKSGETVTIIGEVRKGSGCTVEGKAGTWDYPEGFKAQTGKA